MAHVAQIPPGNPGRTIVIITLAGSDLDRREALADRVMEAAREALAPPPAVNRLAAVFAHLSQPAAPPRPPPPTITLAPEALSAGTVLAGEPDLRATPAVSPYEAPFLLAPLTRRDR